MKSTLQILKEARELVNTPEKLSFVGSVRDACRIADDDGDGGQAFDAFLSQLGDLNPRPAGPGAVSVTFDSFLARFDAAISTEEQRASA